MLSNLADGDIDLGKKAGAPASASIYQLDGIVRRAPALQLTADALAAREAQSLGVPA